MSIPILSIPAGKFAKIVFWDASAGIYSDKGCNAVSSITAKLAVADCNHLTDFGVLFVDVSRSTVCGNSLVDSNEECDDGNSINGDGCSSTCQKELTAANIIVPPLTEYPILAISLGSSLGGFLLLLIVCAVYIRRKRGRIFFCLKNDTSASSRKDEVPRSIEVSKIVELNSLPQTTLVELNSLPQTTLVKLRSAAPSV